MGSVLLDMASSFQPSRSHSPSCPPIGREYGDDAAVAVAPPARPLPALGP